MKAALGWRTFGLVFLMVFGLWAAYPLVAEFFLYKLYASSADKTSQLGQFGDLFGAFNALFTALAFCGFLFALYLQGAELSLQRKELELTREEIAGQRRALSEQNITLERQNFDNRFFQMLRLHNDITNAIDIRTKGAGGVSQVSNVGRDCFAHFYNGVKQCYKSMKAEPGPDHGLRPGIIGPARNAITDERYLDSLASLGIEPDSAAVLAYQVTYRAFQADLGHYFRNLYHIIKMVDESDLELDKRAYTNLVRAQLSTFELVLLFYNCLSPNGAQKFWPLVNKYGLLKNLETELLLDDSHKSAYGISAYLGAALKSS